MSRSRVRKRPRGEAFAKRPIDKLLKAVEQTVTTSQVSTDLITATFPCTIVGIRWAFSHTINSTTANSSNYWAIVIVRDGQVASTLAISNAGPFYEPEQDVLAFGHMTVRDADTSQGPGIAHETGSTKTMRKLKGGDKLEVISIGNAVTGAVFRGVIQFFCKA